MDKIGDVGDDVMEPTLGFVRRLLWILSVEVAAGAVRRREVLEVLEALALERELRRPECRVLPS